MSEANGLREDRALAFRLTAVRDHNAASPLPPASESENGSLPPFRSVTYFPEIRRCASDRQFGVRFLVDG